MVMPAALIGERVHLHPESVALGDSFGTTSNWYVKKKKKKAVAAAKKQKAIQIEMMELIAERDVLKGKLGELNPRKKKDAKRIVAINVALRDIDEELRMLQEESGVPMNELYHGSAFGRFIGKIKRGFRSFKHKVKKWFHKYKEAIVGIAIITIPAIVGSILKAITGRKSETTEND